MTTPGEGDAMPAEDLHCDLCGRTFRSRAALDDHHAERHADGVRAKQVVARRRHQQEMVDDAVADSFPASDPPSFMVPAAGLGTPPRTPRCEDGD